MTISKIQIVILLQACVQQYHFTQMKLKGKDRDAIKRTLNSFKHEYFGGIVFFNENHIKTYCYGLNVCIPPKFLCWNLITKAMATEGGVAGRKLGHEGSTLMSFIRTLNGISVLIKEARRAVFSSCRAEDAVRRHCLCSREPSPDTESAGTLLLDFPASKTESNRLMLFINYLV